jgi:GMP synthase-like glutamine amidotransferase
MGESPCAAVASGRGLLRGFVQSMSVVFGGAVTKARNKEIGWFPVHLTRDGRECTLFCDFPDHFMALHWHGDQFSIPHGAIHVARSDGCDEQAFVYEDRVVGLQFHLEADEKGLAALIDLDGGDVRHGPYIQLPSAIKQAAASLALAQHHLFKLLDTLSHC